MERDQASKFVNDLLRLMVNQRLHAWKNIVVDVESYRQRRVEHLEAAGDGGVGVGGAPVTGGALMS